MTQTTGQEPTYLGLLNDICLQEGRAGVFLGAWADKTPDSQLKECLNLVAARETSHHDIFERRIRELGFVKQEKVDPTFAKRLEVLGSDRNDADKIQWNQEAAAKQPNPTVRDRYMEAMEDEKVDPLTRSLIRWFNDVESDSRDKLMEVYARIEKGS